MRGEAFSYRSLGSVLPDLKVVQYESNIRKDKFKWRLPGAARAGMEFLRIFVWV